MNPPAARVVILADESANWIVAGLRQIERLILSLNELAAQDPARAPRAIEVAWTTDVPAAECRLPGSALPMREISLAELPSEDAVCLTTRLLGTRGALGRVLPQLNGSVTRAAVEEELAIICARERGCRLLRQRSDLPRAEAWFLRSLGKSQDGIIARHFDRRLSLALTRMLLRLHVSPTFITIAIIPFALAAFVAFIYGGWSGVLLGMLLIEAHSILDGCDGEIARATYAESNFGRLLDTACDQGTWILLVAGVALGLWRQAPPGAGALILLEAAATIGAGAAREYLLGRAVAGSRNGDAHGSTLYARHAHLHAGRGIFGLGQRASHFLTQLTKRDVEIAWFILLALLNQGAWILHSAFLFAVLSCVAAWRALPSRLRAA